MIEAFSYRAHPIVRSFSPSGYQDYGSYKPWLRHDFYYRCAYCLTREVWVQGDLDFQIDHFVPVSVNSKLTCIYSNLIYACNQCNLLKSNCKIEVSPCDSTFEPHLEFQLDGTIKELTEEGKEIAEILRLNNRTRVSFRKQWIDLLVLAKQRNLTVYQRILGFPLNNLDDLRKLRPPGNNGPSSVQECHFVQHERGVLPKTY